MGTEKWTVTLSDPTHGFMERAMGIEPTSEAWEAPILPLNYARSLFLIVLEESTIHAAVLILAAHPQRSTGCGKAKQASFG